jgi:hypothetical protein
LITIHTLRAFVAIKGTQSFSHALDVLYSRTIHIQLYFAFVKRQIVCFGDTCDKFQGDRDASRGPRLIIEMSKGDRNLHGGLTGYFV